MTGQASRRYAPWMWLMLSLFIVRVVAQPVALWVDAWFLPRFESWHSGAQPYPLLVTAQVLIIAWLARTAAQFSAGRVVARRPLGQVMLVLGAVYFTTMLARLVLGATWLRDQRWFASPIPTVFHLVLATALLLYGHFHWRYGSTMSNH